MKGEESEVPDSDAIDGVKEAHPRPASSEQSTEPSRASTASQHRSSLSRVEEAGAENERDHESQDDQVADLERMSESSDVP